MTSEENSVGRDWERGGVRRGGRGGVGGRGRNLLKYNSKGEIEWWRRTYQYTVCCLFTAKTRDGIPL